MEKERQKPLRKIYNEGIRWQGWTEKKRASCLLMKKAMGSLLGFFEIDRSGWKKRGEKTGATVGAKR